MRPMNVATTACAAALVAFAAAPMIAAAPAPAAAPAAALTRLAFDHVLIFVSPGAPERVALERAGFQISPDVNRHDGQGTASVTVEFDNSFLELIWADSSVSIQPGLERAAEKFRQRMLWRTTGRSPIGIGMRRASAGPDSFPFPTWSWSAEWMPKGAEMLMLTPRDDKFSPALSVEPRALADTAEQAARGARFHHPNGARRITAVRVISPRTYQPIPSLQFARSQHVLALGQGDQWLLELTLDAGRRKARRDLRPDLPLVVRY